MQRSSAEVQADFRIMVLEASNVPKELGHPGPFWGILVVDLYTSIPEVDVQFVTTSAGRKFLKFWGLRFGKPILRVFDTWHRPAKQV